MIALAITTLSSAGVAALATSLATPAAAASGTALINADTVTGSPSVEETTATNLGLTVTVVSGKAWDAMSASDFAAYTVLLVGDPTCGPLAPSVTANASTWTSAVMATAGGNTVVGNRVVWGASPVSAGLSNPGAGKGIKDGIGFAAALSPDTGHATGVFLDTSCDGTLGADAALVDTLNMLSVGTARPWTEDPHPACGSTVSLIGTAPEFADITSSDLAGWNCSVRVAFPTFETDFVPLAIGTDPPNPVSTCGTDTTTQATNCGEAYFLAAGPELTAMDSEISVTPLTATNPVGATHTITATVKSVDGGPLVGQLVSFSVSGANAGATGTCVPVDCKSDGTGTVTFTYTGVNAGIDTITASFMCNPAIHTATAEKTWVAPPPTTAPPTTAAPTTAPPTTAPPTTAPPTTAPPTTAPPTTAPPTTTPPSGRPPSIFQVELRKCTLLHVGYNRFPAGTEVSWDVSQHGKSLATGTFTTLGGGKKFHFLSPPLGVTLKHGKNPKAGVHLSWTVGGTTTDYKVARQPGC